MQYSRAGESASTVGGKLIKNGSDTVRRALPNDVAVVVVSRCIDVVCGSWVGFSHSLPLLSAAGGGNRWAKCGWHLHAAHTRAHARERAGV